MNLLSSPHHPFGNYCSYLVRFWQDSPQAAWRASAQEVQTGRTLRFADLDSLFAFLRAQTEKGSNQRSRENKGGN